MIIFEDDSVTILISLMWSNEPNLAAAAAGGGPAVEMEYGIIVGGYNRMGQQGPTIGGVM